MTKNPQNMYKILNFQKSSIILKGKRMNEMKFDSRRVCKYYRRLVSINVSSTTTTFFEDYPLKN